MSAIESGCKGLSRRGFLMGLGAASGAFALGAAGCAPKIDDGMGPLESDVKVFDGAAKGRNGDIVVKISLAGASIQSVSVVKHCENSLISDEALSRIPAEIVRCNTPNVDAVSGASLTSWGIIGAVKDALAQADVAESDLKQTSKPKVPRQDPIRADVAVVGGGLAGLTCAARLLERGKTVALFEESGHLGGCAIAAYGWLLNVGTMLEEGEGTHDSPEQYLKHMDDVAALYGEKVEYPEVARAYAENNGPMVNWLDKSLNVDFGQRTGTLGIYDPEEIRRIYPINGFAKALVRTMIDRVEMGVREGKASIALEARVIKLLTASDGSVRGVRVRYANGDKLDYEYPATVLATGGFCHSIKKQREYGVYENVGSCNPSTAEGHGLDIALDVGCQSVLMDRRASYGGGIKGESDEIRYLANLTTGGQIWVDARGKRLIKEDGTRFSQKAWNDAERNEMFVIFSEATLPPSPIVNYYGYLEGELTPWQSQQMLVDLEAEGKVVFSGADAAELAAKAGIDAAALVKTIGDYNSYCDAGKDLEFGLEDLRKFEGKLYAIKTIPYLLMARGGLRVSPKAEALDAAQNPIGGLYVAGEQIGLHQYAGMISNGAGLGGATTWGYIAAETIATC